MNDQQRAFDEFGKWLQDRLGAAPEDTAPPPPMPRAPRPDPSQGMGTAPAGDPAALFAALVNGGPTRHSTSPGPAGTRQHF